ncbi:hypothetical protein Csa_019006, partial [Cucumis sativus]
VDMVEGTVAEASNPAVQMTMGYKGGCRKMISVIPKQRKLVKTMMYHSIKCFIISFFRLSFSTATGTGAPP